MTREQIEKAARRYALDQLGIVGLPGRAEAMKAFLAGAQWRIESAWHDRNEMPEEGELIMSIDNEKQLSIYHVENVKTMFKYLGICAWAYVDDLLPERKEVSE